MTPEQYGEYVTDGHSYEPAGLPTYTEQNNPFERTREKLRERVQQAAYDEAEYTQAGFHPVFAAALDALVRFEQTWAVWVREKADGHLCVDCPVEQELEAIIRETLGEDA